MFHYHILPNGLRIILSPRQTPVVYVGVYINVGSRDEQPTEEGMAHFIEHSLFKGTEHRKAYHILNRIDGVGGELNAFTTKEETCVYASATKEHLGRCLELFSDVLFHSVFPLHEIENEKDVVVEEINSYRDTPAEQIYDDFEEMIFDGHPLAHNILGSKRNVRRFTPEALRGFMRDHYTPDRMVVSVVGDVAMSRLVRMCDHYFGSYAAGIGHTRGDQTPRPRQFRQILHRHTHQTHLMMGCPAPGIFDEDKVPFTLLNNLLGGPAMNSRLNVAIRERHGFCYTIESQFVPFSDTGLFYLYAGIEDSSLDHAVELIERELQRLCDTPLTTTQLHAAQRQLVGQMTINNDTAMNEMQSIGKAFLNFERVDTLEEMNRDVMQVTAADLQRVARRYLNKTDLSYLIYN